MLLLGTAKAAVLIQCCAFLVSAYSETPGFRSALLFPIRLGKPTPAGSAPGTVTVMNGPDWNIRIPPNSQPPPPWPKPQPFGPATPYTILLRNPHPLPH